MKRAATGKVKGPSAPKFGPKEKVQARPPMGGRYSRSEGAGPGPERHHNPKPARR